MPAFSYLPGLNYRNLTYSYLFWSILIYSDIFWSNLIYSNIHNILQAEVPLPRQAPETQQLLLLGLLPLNGPQVGWQLILLKLLNLLDHLILLIFWINLKSPDSPEIRVTSPGISLNRSEPVSTHTAVFLVFCLIGHFPPNVFACSDDLVSCGLEGILFWNDSNKFLK